MRTATSLIQEYKELYDEGSLTTDEYNFLKKHLLELGDAQFDEEVDIYEMSEQRVEAARRAKRKNSISNIAMVAAAIGIIVCIVITIVSCMSLSSDDSDSGDYETYYQDDNGNGELDQGEWNYTVDDNGDVVDVDDDLNNFE